VLPESERLRKNSEFKAVYNLRRSVANSLFILYTGKLKDNLEIPVKVGFVVGKKIHKKAHERNYIKRMMREAYRSAGKTVDIPLNQWKSLIFLARPNVLEVNYKEVYDGIVDCLKIADKKYGQSKIKKD
jgi:ribonuclease P protein component